MADHDTTLLLSEHVRGRLQQRGMTPADVEYIYIHGTLIFKQQVIFCVLRWGDLPTTDRINESCCRLVDTVLIIADNVLITAYRNPNAYRAISRKVKFRMDAENLRERKRGCLAS